MGLFTNLVLGLVHLCLVAMDGLFLLLLATMLSYRWQPPWLLAICSAGRPVVDWFTDRLGKGLGASSERTVLFVGMLALSLIRTLVVVLLGR